MFKKGPDIDRKKLLLKALDVKKDSLTRLKHFKLLIEHADLNEVLALFKTHFSFIYHTFIDTFSTFDCNSKQRREDLDSILFMLEKILIFNPELIKKRWQFYSITFVMQKLLHQGNTCRLRQEGVRLFVLWYLILCDDTSVELESMFASIVPGLVLNQTPSAPTLGIPPPSTTSPSNNNNNQHNNASPQTPIKLCSIDPLVPMSQNEHLQDETSFYLDSLLQYIVTQTTRPHWSVSEEVRRNQENSFSFLYNMLKRTYLPVLFPSFRDQTFPPHKQPLQQQALAHNSQHIHDIDESSIPPMRPDRSPPYKPRRELFRHTEKNSSPNYLSAGPAAAVSNVEHERLMILSMYQSIVLRWLTRIMRQDMIPGQDDLIKPAGAAGGGGSIESRDFQRGREQNEQDHELSCTSESNSTAILETTSREMEIARKVAGTWPENVAVMHELFRTAFLNYFQPASMKRVVNVYKEWICNGGLSQSGSAQGRGITKLGYTSFGDLLQVFVINSSNAFLINVHSAAVLDEQVEMCKRIMNIYRFMVMKIYMNTVTWEQLLNVMLSITRNLFSSQPPEKKELTIGGRIAPAFFQTFIVSWIRANLYVHISSQMWSEFHHIMKNLVRWRELIEEWSTTMGSLTRVLVKHVYKLSLIDLPLDKPQERRRRPRAMKSFSTVGPSSSNKSPDHQNAVDETDSHRSNTKGPNSSRLSNQQKDNRIREEINLKGLVRSNSDGIICLKGAKMYISSAAASDQNSLSFSVGQRRIKSEHLIIDNCIDLTTSYRSRSPSQNDVIDGTSLKDSMIMVNDQVIEPQVPPKASSNVAKSTTKKVEIKPIQDKCVLLGGSVRGWTPENSVIMWRRMLGLFGNINLIEDPESHLIVLKCLGTILDDFIKTRENLGISTDNQSTPKQPDLIPPITYHVGWLLQATHLPTDQFRESVALAYKLLCQMSIRKHDTELPQQYHIAFYDALHRGLNAEDTYIHGSIISNCTQLMSLELPGSTILIQDLLEKSLSLILNSHPKEFSQSTQVPRDQAIQVLNHILSLHKSVKKLTVLKPEANSITTLPSPIDIKSKVFDTLQNCVIQPVAPLDTQTRSRALCSLTLYVYQELCDKSDSLEIEKLFDTLLTDLQDNSNSNLFRITCDLLRLFAEHAVTLSKSRPTLVSSIIQVICQLIVRRSTNENNKETIQCLLICLEDWCIALGKNFLFKPIISLSFDEEETLPTSLNESLATIVLRSLENVVNDEQFIEPDSVNNGPRGSMSTSRSSDTQSGGHASQVGSHSGDVAGVGTNSLKDRTITNENQNKDDSTSSQENKNLQSIKLACKVVHTKLITYLGQFPFKQVGAASMSCYVDESDYLSDGQEDLKNASNIVLVAMNNNTIVSFMASQGDKVTQENETVHLIVRNICGKYAWDASYVDLKQHFKSEDKQQDSQQNSIIIDPDSFQQEESRNSIKCDSDLNEDGNSSSSLSSRSSVNRDYIGDLLNQLNSLMSSSGSSNCSSQHGHKKRNTARSVSNSKYKIAQAEETMIALLTNQRFQELNYCERSEEMVREMTYLTAATNNSDMIHSSSDNNSRMPFELCRELFQQLGYLSWEKRCKVNSLAKSARLSRELKNLDSQASRETHKIAVIYVANGQEDKNSILMNSVASKAFEGFVSSLGWEVNLASHLGFKGGLQSNKSTGETSPYFCNSTTEVMFHVSTRIPINGPADDEGLNKKLRHLGNDEVHIIWSEHTRDYRREIIPTEFSDVIIAIYPMQTFQGYYRVQVNSKPDVPLFGPLFDNCIVHHTCLASLARATAINASRAKRLKLPYYQSHFEERNRLIDNIIQNHTEKLSFEDYTAQLY